MSRCRSCDAEIAWVKLPSGKLNPVNGEAPQEYRLFPKLAPGAGKRLTLITDAGAVISGYRAPELAPGAIRVMAWESHFATCPEREGWRKR